ncbi:MAG: 3-dehydroquinate synthase [Steroidobacteraceae bacterium]|nr:3-dehydroquinate synthase [Steroidobacteraceae bacterium]MCC7198376.1 3-dehydroquinate synthase [Gammaproteobacteria bacterium]
MDSLRIELGERAYPIYIGPRLLGDAGLLERVLGRRDVLVVSNETVAPLWLGRLRSGLGTRRLAQHLLPDGEQYKTMEAFSAVLDALVNARFNRDCVVVALGGGVVGDIAGFAAACYQRGVDFVQMPTTLLAQVDSSVGGKTGINHSGGKNLIGAFHQPIAVVADTDALSTLPQRELRAGLAEVIKYGLIRDEPFLGWLESSLDALLARDPAALAQAIRRSCEIKAEIVALDERETGATRALLNLGHTFGHAIETAAGYGAWLHGEAVATGMLLAAELSQRLGWLGVAEVDRIRALLVRAGLPTDPPRLGRTRMLQLMRMDKKVREGQLRLVLLKRLGNAVFTADYSADELELLLKARVGEAAP